MAEVAHSAEKDAVERDLWWGYLCPALSNIGALKEAQSDLIALGADWAEAGRILSRVQSFYVDAAHQAAQRYLAAIRDLPPADTEHQAANNLPGNMHPGSREQCRVRGCARVLPPGK